jgi:DNA-binding MarR family transcriptional regulator
MTRAGSQSPYDALQRVFHEPHRLAIMSALLSVPGGLTFSQLRDELGLTDGNLSRHLKALQDADAIRMDKTFAANRPRTTVFLSKEGRSRFLDYLDALEEVLAQAASRADQRESEAAKRARAGGPNLATT